MYLGRTEIWHAQAYRHDPRSQDWAVWSWPIQALYLFLVGILNLIRTIRVVFYILLRPADNLPAVMSKLRLLLTLPSSSPLVPSRFCSVVLHAEQRQNKIIKFSLLG
jgi:hypothetical protein